MTCDECRDVMLEVARCRAAPFVEQSVYDHTDGCAECAASLTRQLALTAGLRALAGAQQEAPDAAALEARLLTAFAVSHTQPVVRRGSDVAWPTWRPRVAAALVVLSAGAAAWWLATPARVTDAPSSVARVEPSAAPLAAPRISAPPEPERGRETPRARPVRSTSSKPRGTRSTPAAPVESAAFTPIPAAAGLPDFESGEIVRLGIDVTALPNYGLEIPAGAQSAVQADLLIGQDGQARAIRLVNANLEDARRRR